MILQFDIHLRFEYISPIHLSAGVLKCKTYKSKMCKSVTSYSAIGVKCDTV